MSTRIVLHSLMLIALLGLLGACASRDRTARTDTGVPGTDGGTPRADAAAGGDAASSTDAATGRDAATGTDAAPASDAFVPPGSDAGLDAFVPPTSDGGRDAFVPPASDAGRDAFVPPVDGGGGCTPLPTTTPLVINGDVAGGPTYNRPTTACGTPSAVGTSVFYDARVFCNPGAARAYSFALDAGATGGLGDPFLIIYTGTGDVATLACLASDDDSGSGGSNSLATATVPTGDITVVATDFDNASTGSYVLTITPL